MTSDDNLAALKKVDRPILVTGGGGFLGRAIVRRLLQLGLSVRSFSRRRHAELTLLDVEQIRGDLADPEAVLKAVGGGEIVIHTAAKPPPWGRRRYGDPRSGLPKARDRRPRSHQLAQCGV
jgi:nucleoside-diphosphate-sugar epimerase